MASKHSKKKRSLTSHQIDKLVSILKEEDKPLRAATLAKAVGYSSAKDVNPTLQKLAQDGLVAQITINSMPMWKVGNGVPLPPVEKVEENTLDNESDALKMNDTPNGEPDKASRAAACNDTNMVEQGMPSYTATQNNVDLSNTNTTIPTPSELSPCTRPDEYVRNCDQQLNNSVDVGLSQNTTTPSHHKPLPSTQHAAEYFQPTKNAKDYVSNCEEQFTDSPHSVGSSFGVQNQSSDMPIHSIYNSEITQDMAFSSTKGATTYTRQNANSTFSIYTPNPSLTNASPSYNTPDFLLSSGDYPVSSNVAPASVASRASSTMNYNPSGFDNSNRTSVAFGSTNNISPSQVHASSRPTSFTSYNTTSSRATPTGNTSLGASGNMFLATNHLNPGQSNVCDYNKFGNTNELPATYLTPSLLNGEDTQGFSTSFGSHDTQPTQISSESPYAKQNHPFSPQNQNRVQATLTAKSPVFQAGYLSPSQTHQQAYSTHSFVNHPSHSVHSPTYQTAYTSPPSMAQQSYDNPNPMISCSYNNDQSTMRQSSYSQIGQPSYNSSKPSYNNQIGQSSGTGNIYMAQSSASSQNQQCPPLYNSHSLHVNSQTQLNEQSGSYQSGGPPSPYNQHSHLTQQPYHSQPAFNNNNMGQAVYSTLSQRAHRDVTLGKQAVYNGSPSYQAGQTNSYTKSVVNNQPGYGNPSQIHGGQSQSKFTTGSIPASQGQQSSNSNQMQLIQGGCSSQMNSFGLNNQSQSSPSSYNSQKPPSSVYTYSGQSNPSRSLNFSATPSMQSGPSYYTGSQDARLDNTNKSGMDKTAFNSSRLTSSPNVTGHTNQKRLVSDNSTKSLHISQKQQSQKDSNQKVVQILQKPQKWPGSDLKMANGIQMDKTSAGGHQKPPYTILKQQASSNNSNQRPNQSGPRQEVSQRDISNSLNKRFVSSSENQHTFLGDNPKKSSRATSEMGKAQVRTCNDSSKYQGNGSDEKQTSPYSGATARKGDATKTEEKVNASEHSMMNGHVPVSPASGKTKDQTPKQQSKKGSKRQRPHCSYMSRYRALLLDQLNANDVLLAYLNLQCRIIDAATVYRIRAQRTQREASKVLLDSVEQCHRRDVLKALCEGLNMSGQAYLAKALQFAESKYRQVGSRPKQGSSSNKNRQREEELKSPQKSKGRNTDSQKVEQKDASTDKENITTFDSKDKKDRDKKEGSGKKVESAKGDSDEQQVKPPREEILSSMIPDEDFLSHLLEQKVLSDETYKQIRGKSCRQEKIDVVLALLAQQGDHCLDALCSALVKSHQPYLAHQLLQKKTPV